MYRSYDRPLDEECVFDFVSYCSTKTYVVDTQKNRLHTTVLLSTQNSCVTLMSKKINTSFILIHASRLVSQFSEMLWLVELKSSVWCICN